MKNRISGPANWGTVTTGVAETKALLKKGGKPEYGTLKRFVG